MGSFLRSGLSHSGNERHVIYMNTGAEQRGVPRFADVSGLSGVDLPEDGRGVATVDWDGDGDLDLWFSNRTAPQVRYFENRWAQDVGTSISLLLEGDGRRINRDAIGARVTLTIREAGSDKVVPIVRTVRCGEGFLSQSSRRLHFGFPKNAKVLGVVVAWPGGEVEKFNSLEPGLRYRLQPGGRYTVDRPKARPVEAQDPLPLVTATARPFYVLRPPLPPLHYEAPDGEKTTLLPKLAEASKPTLLLFWSGTCEDCLGELKALAAQGENPLGPDCRVVALNSDRVTGAKSPDDITKIGDHLTWGHATPRIARLFETLASTTLVLPGEFGVPTSFLITPEGRLAATYRGALDLELIEADLANLESEPMARRDYALPFKGRWQSKVLQSNLDHLGSTFLWNGDFEMAELCLVNAVEYHKNDPGVWFDLSMSQLQREKYQEALKSLSRGIEVQIAEISVSDSPDEKQQETLAKMYANKAHVLHKLADKEKRLAVSARQAAQKALALQPDNLLALETLAYLDTKEGSYTRAAEGFLSILQLRPGYLRAEQNLKRVIDHCSRSGDMDVDTWLSTTWRNDPSRRLLGHEYARRRWKAGASDEAQTCYEELLATDPQDGTALVQLGLLHQHNGDFSASLVRLRAALACLSSERAEWRIRARAGLGLALWKTGDRFGAEDELAVAATEGSTTAVTNLGLLLAESGRYPEARPHFAKATELAPESAEAQANLALCLARMGNREGALSAYRRALELDPDHSRAHFGITNLRPIPK